jgi:putative aldouronate transport system permease protein
MIRRTPGEMLFTVFNTALLSFLCMVTIYPFLHVAAASVSEPGLLIQHTGLLFWPLGFTTAGYERVLANANVLRGFFNSALYVVLGTTAKMIFTILGAYVLSRKNLYWGKAMALAIVFTMFFDGGLIPRYFIVRDLGLLDNPLSIVLPRLIITYNLIIMRTYFMSLPDSLEESARIDGAHDLSILVRIVLPLSASVTAVLVLFYGVALWNTWFEALIYIRNRALWPIQLFLREILIANQAEEMLEGVAHLGDRENLSESIKYAIIVVSTVPVVLAYPFMQRYFVKGVMIGAIKG